MNTLDIARVVRMLNTDDSGGMYNMLGGFAKSVGATYDPRLGRWFVPDGYRSSSREFCHARHICHHWFEDECSSDCDNGLHDHPIGGCAA